MMQDNQIRVTDTFKKNGSNADPDVVTLTIKSPNGSETVYTYGASAIVKSAVGVYYFDHIPTVEGRWSYTWKGTGTVYARSRYIHLVSDEA